MEKIDEEIRRFAAATLAHSRQAARHAGALKQLAARFSSIELQSLNEQARGQWLGLMRNHARSLHDEMLSLRAALTPIFASGNHNADNQTIDGDAELRRACDQLFALCAASDRAIIAAFTLSSDSTPAAAVKTPGFQANLHRIEHLADAVIKHTSAEK